MRIFVLVGLGILLIVSLALNALLALLVFQWPRWVEPALGSGEYVAGLGMRTTDSGESRFVLSRIQGTGAVLEATPHGVAEFNHTPGVQLARLAIEDPIVDAYEVSLEGRPLLRVGLVQRMDGGPAYIVQPGTGTSWDMQLRFTRDP
jgi:hypothetical protein